MCINAAPSLPLWCCSIYSPSPQIRLKTIVRIKTAFRIRYSLSVCRTAFFFKYCTLEKMNVCICLTAEHQYPVLKTVERSAEGHFKNALALHVKTPSAAVRRSSEMSERGAALQGDNGNNQRRRAANRRTKRQMASFMMGVFQRYFTTY